MAVKSLDEVLSTLSADEKKLLENTLSKNPELKDGWLRQDDYSREQNKLKAEREAMAADLDHAERMKVWGEKNVPIYDGLVAKGIINEEGEELWTGQKADLETQLAAARAAAVAGGEMDPAELKRNVEEIVKANGGVTRAELDALIASETKKLTEATFDAKYADKEVEFNSKTIPFVTGFSTSMALAAAKYERDTGKEFTDADTKAVFEMMTKEKKFDPREMVAEYAKPHLQRKTDDAEVERRVEARLAEERKNRGLPGAGDEPFIPQSTEVGNIKKMLERSAGEGDFESAVMAAAVKGATELATEGKRV